MTYTSIVSSTAGILLITFMIYHVHATGKRKRKTWIVPALLSALFLGYSVQTMITEGPLGFWETHVSSLWGTQIWVDLLLAIGIGWYFAVPKAKALGMRVAPWILVILATGCIGFLALLSRIMYLEQLNPVPQEA